jgi:amino acid adenylation domain-containing protein
MSRNAQMIVAIVAVLKAGAAYVPLDIAYPEDRLKYMLEDSGIRLLLVQDPLPVFASFNEVNQVCFGQEWREIALQSDEEMAPRSTPESLAYVMYTSGSTGMPKGVAVTHRNVARLVLGTDYIDFGSNEVFLQFAPVSFDAATFEIWGPLLNGATLVVFAGDPSLPELGRYVKQYKITTLWLTAGLFHLMIEEQIDDLREVSQLIAGGDVLRPDVVKKAFRELPRCLLVNGYGPTEGTTFSCCYKVNSEVEGLSTVPIGKAIYNSTAYVFDEGMNLSPVGMAGELLIGGDGLARGYWNHPVLTAEKFIPDPFSRVPGGRLYRSGDLARCRIDGNIEFLGRMDKQVKIRGFRVDLREIEFALISHGDVSEAVVITRETRRGDQEIVAYLVVQNPDCEFVTEKIKEYLRHKLPAYMVPAAIVQIDHVPLTANGKLDRTALPVHEEADYVDYVAPDTATERVLAAIWQDMLRVERPGIHDNFFDLGGHSLSALQVISRIREAFRVEIPLRVLFEEPTIAGLSRNIESNITSENGRPQLVRVSREAHMVQMAADEVPVLPVSLSE